MADSEELKEVLRRQRDEALQGLQPETAEQIEESRNQDLLENFQQQSEEYFQKCEEDIRKLIEETVTAPREALERGEIQDDLRRMHTRTRRSHPLEMIMRTT
jgi:hypothetical protein